MTTNKPICEKDAKKLARGFCELLAKQHGAPERVKPQEPLDDVIECLLAENAGWRKARKALQELKKRFVDWNEARVSRTGEILEVIRPHPNDEAVAERIRRLLVAVCERRNEMTLKYLLDLSHKDATPFLDYLRNSDPDAAAYLKLRSLDMGVVPLSPEIRRIAVRFGLLMEEWTADEARNRLEKVAPKELAGDFFHLASEHALTICLPGRPLCHKCAAAKICRTGQEETAKGRKKEKKATAKGETRL